jgi:hypothetical protein
LIPFHPHVLYEKALLAGGVCADTVPERTTLEGRIRISMATKKAATKKGVKKKMVTAKAVTKKKTIVKAVKKSGTPRTGLKTGLKTKTATA